MQGWLLFYEFNVTLTFTTIPGYFYSDALPFSQFNIFTYQLSKILSFCPESLSFSLSLVVHSCSCSCTHLKPQAPLWFFHSLCSSNSINHKVLFVSFKMLLVSILLMLLSLMFQLIDKKKKNEHLLRPHHVPGNQMYWV